MPCRSSGYSSQGADPRPAVDSLIQRGILYRLAGDAAAWPAVLDLAPGTPAAQAARRNLEPLDAKVD